MNNHFFTSDLSGKEFPLKERVKASLIRKSIIETIQKEHPDFSEKSNLSMSELNYYRSRYISDYLINEIGELSDLERNVVSSMNKHSTITDKVVGEEESQLSFGQKMSDIVASFGGSWMFIISFGILIFIWVTINTIFLLNRSFDPYPYILLNLVLSCIAALQAPIIMMSQNRMEEKDRDRAKKDYMINLKSELEIRMLHEKIDHLIMRQQQELMEIQKMQVSMMEDILNRIK